MMTRRRFDLQPPSSPGDLGLDIFLKENPAQA